MISIPRFVITACLGWLAAGTALASELSYTFLDFLYLDQEVDAAGIQQPVPDQTVAVASGAADGIGLAGSLGLGDRFFLGGGYRSSIVEITGTITNPLTTVTIEDDYDLTTTELGFGFVQPFGDNFDLVLEATLDSVEYDFGSLAGENFDVDDSGVGARIGFRWNPSRAIEIHASTQYLSAGEVSLDRLAFESDVVTRAGLIWYFFEDLGLSLSYESGQIDSTAVTMRFSFGTLQW